MRPKAGKSDERRLATSMPENLLQLARWPFNDTLSSVAIDADGFIHQIAQTQADAIRSENYGHGRGHQILQPQ